MHIEEKLSRNSKGDVEMHACLEIEKDREVVKVDDKLRSFDLGSLRNTGLENLIQLSNAVNSMLLKTQAQNGYDSIASSRSYGLVYLIDSALKELELTNTDVQQENSEEEIDEIIECLPSLIAALLDPYTSDEAPLTAVQKRMYFPIDRELSGRDVKTINLAIQLEYFKSGLEYRCDDFSKSGDLSLFNFVEDIAVPDESEQSLDQLRRISMKLMFWSSDDGENWDVTVSNDSMKNLIDLSLLVKDYLEARSGMKWHDICNCMLDLSIMQHESGDSTLMITTRPTSSQLQTFYRMEIEPPAMVVNHKPPNSLSEMEEGDSIVDEVFELLSR